MAYGDDRGRRRVEGVPRGHEAYRKIKGIRPPVKKYSGTQDIILGYGSAEKKRQEIREMWKENRTNLVFILQNYLSKRLSEEDFSRDYGRAAD